MFLRTLDKSLPTNGFLPRQFLCQCQKLIFPNKNHGDNCPKSVKCKERAQRSLWAASLDAAHTDTQDDGFRVARVSPQIFLTGFALEHCTGAMWAPRRRHRLWKLGERKPREKSNCWSGCCSPYNSVTGTENCQHGDPRDASSRCAIWSAEISNFLDGLWHPLLPWLPLQCVSFRTKHTASATGSRPLYWKQWIDLK